MQKSKLKFKIQNELNEAIKKENKISRSTLRMLLAAILNKEKEKKYREKIEGEAELTEEEIIEAVSSEIKKRKEAILEFEKGKREDLVQKEKAEMEVLKKYLPEQLPEEEIRKLVKAAIEKVGAKEIHPVKSAKGGVPQKAEQFNRVRDIGKVMAEIMPKIKGRSDGSTVNRIVKELLT